MSRQASPACAGDAARTVQPLRFQPCTSAAGERGARSSFSRDSRINTLAQTTHPRGGRTVEELVSELLRPMLKAWLDDNLPAIVERLVRAEIERVSRARD